MSGHSKWSTIKHKKAKVDAQKGVMFAKFSREITVAAKMGGTDPNSNFRLRTAIDKAKESGLPNDNIKRAVDKAAGAGGSGPGYGVRDACPARSHSAQSSPFCRHTGCSARCLKRGSRCRYSHRTECRRQRCRAPPWPHVSTARTGPTPTPVHP